MGNVTEHLVKGSDNPVTLNILEDGSPLQGTWTELTINIGSGLVVITRAADGNGIAFASGVLAITPSLLSESLAALVVGNLYPVVIAVKGATSTEGYHYGALDSSSRLWFEIGEV